jgi:hypothetical protein
MDDMNVDSMFETKRVPRGTTLYKGMRSVSCKTVLNSVHYFFVTDDVSVAKLYATRDLCQYRASRQLNLFNMTNDNIRKLLLSDTSLSFEDKRVIAMVTGVEVQKRNQAMYFSEIHANMRKYLTDCSPGERFSHHTTNKLACIRMCAMFANLGYDGYVANDTQSVFHGGAFHKEIMLCNATDVLEVVKSSVPVLSKTQFKKDGVLTMLKLYAKRSKNFLNMFNDMAYYVTPVVAPGMAVKMYSEQQQQDSSNNETLRIVRNTLDLDITVYANFPVRLKELVHTVFYRFDLACNHFVDLLNQEYDDLNVRLVSRCRKNPSSGECLVDTARKQGFPLINRNVFSVKQYFILFPDQTEIELMDVAVVYQQAGRVPTLHHTLSNATGFPLPTRGYLADELWSMIRIDTFGESNLNRKRHPITGKEKQKGVKDLYRLKYVAYSNRDNNKRVYSKYHGVIVHLINILKKKDYTNATKV